MWIQFHRKCNATIKAFFKAIWIPELRVSESGKTLFIFVDLASGKAFIPLKVSASEMERKLDLKIRQILFLIFKIIPETYVIHT